jgi:hypothetical protein
VAHADRAVAVVAIAAAMIVAVAVVAGAMIVAAVATIRTTAAKS